MCLYDWGRDFIFFNMDTRLFSKLTLWNSLICYILLLFLEPLGFSVDTTISMRIKSLNSFFLMFVFFPFLAHCSKMPSSRLGMKGEDGHLCLTNNERRQAFPILISIHDDNQHQWEIYSDRLQTPSCHHT